MFPSRRSAFTAYAYHVTNGEIVAKFNKFKLEDMGDIFERLFGISKMDQEIILTRKATHAQFFIRAKTNL
jgi:hypothetical protein